MKILGLHGYIQRGEIIHKKLEKLFGKSHEFVCPDGPFEVPEGNGEKRGWWFLAGTSSLRTPQNFDYRPDSVPAGHYDIVVAFSQGTIMATLLLSEGVITASKVVLMSPFEIMDKSWADRVAQSPIKLAPIVVIGEKDPLATADESLLIIKYYEGHKIYMHKYGHVIPTNKDLKTLIMS
jgi:hypothetical protein